MSTDQSFGSSKSLLLWNRYIVDVMTSKLMFLGRSFNWWVMMMGAKNSIIKPNNKQMKSSKRDLMISLHILWFYLSRFYKVLKVIQFKQLNFLHRKDQQKKNFLSIYFVFLLLEMLLWVYLEIKDRFPLKNVLAALSWLILLGTLIVLKLRLNIT